MYHFLAASSKMCQFVTQHSSDFASCPLICPLLTVCFKDILSAQVLCKDQDRQDCSCRLPKCYGKKMREKLRAGPGCEDLKMRCPYFYSVAMDLQSFMYNDDALAPFIEKTFRDRYQVSCKAFAGHQVFHYCTALRAIRS